MNISELEAEARKLPAPERERLATRLLDDVHREQLSEIDEAWLAVAEERFADFKAGRDPGLTAEEFFGRIEKARGWS